MTAENGNNGNRKLDGKPTRIILAASILATGVADIANATENGENIVSSDSIVQKWDGEIPSEVGMENFFKENKLTTASVKSPSQIRLDQTNSLASRDGWEIKRSPETVKSNKLILEMGTNNYRINGQEKKSDVKFYFNELGRSIGPAKYISEGLGYSIKTDSASKNIFYGLNSTEQAYYNKGQLNKIKWNDGKRRLVMKLGSKQVVVNGKKELTDTAPFIFQGRVMTAIGNTAKLLGSSSRYDKPSNRIFIAYTSEEFNKIVGSGGDIAGNKLELDYNYSAENVKQAMKYMAGGEYVSPSDISEVTVAKDRNSGALVVFPENNPTSKETVLKLAKNFKSGDVAYAMGGKVFLFDNKNLKKGYKNLIEYDARGNNKTLSTENDWKFDFSKLSWDKNGIFVFDGTKKTHKLNIATDKFEELKKPEFVGTLEQRTVHNLLEAYNLSYNNISNPLGIDYEDIMEFKRTGSDENTKSFKLIRVDNNLGFITLVGGKTGLQMEKSLINLKTMIQRWQEIDPEVPKNWVEMGLDFFATDILPSGTFFTGSEKGWLSSYNPYPFGGVIFYNEGRRDFAMAPVVFNTVLTGESEGLKFRYHLKNGVSIINGVEYTDEKTYKYGETMKLVAKYFPPDWDGKWDGYKPLNDIFPNWDWRTQGKY